MNYHRRIKLDKARAKVMGQWSTTNQKGQLGKVGKNSRGNPLTYGRLPGNGTETFWSQSELYLIEPCFCERCTKFLKENYGIKAEWQSEPQSVLVELESDEKFLTYDFRERGSTVVPRARGIIKILRALQADTKGPWTTKPFWFTTCNCTKKQVRKGECKHGKLVKPGHWQIEKFDQLTRVEQWQAKPVNAKVIHPEKSPYDDKIDFESRAQMNAEFEKRFSQ